MFAMFFRSLFSLFLDKPTHVSAYILFRICEEKISGMHASFRLIRHPWYRETIYMGMVPGRTNDLFPAPFPSGDCARRNLAERR